MKSVAIGKNDYLQQTIRTAIVITAMVMLPVLVHLVPFSGSAPLGAYLLPMFIAPLVGAYYISPVGLMVAALAAPLLNHVLTGMPSQPTMYLLMGELAIFSLLLSWSVKRDWRFFGISALAFFAAKCLIYVPSTVLLGGEISLSQFGNFLSGLLVALPGMLILLGVEWYMDRR
jgi:hypothetical protein